MQKIKFPDWSKELFNQHRYKIMYGGRGSGKSYTVADYLLVAGAHESMRILCAREFQNSLGDSVLHLLAERIQVLGLADFYEVQREKILGRNGTEFVFKGVRNNVQSIKSMSQIKKCWIEEAQTISKISLDVLIPTIRDEGSEIIMTFNPLNASDPVYENFVVNTPTNAWIRKVNWRDNPFWPSVLEAERLALQQKDPDLYAHVYEGECLEITDANIFKGKYVVDVLDIPPKYNGPYIGIDFGFSVDPTAVTLSYIFDNILYVRHEAGGTKIELDTLPKYILDNIPEAANHAVYADSARPDTISFLKRHGISRIKPAKKDKNSIIDGIEFIKQFDKIVIHPDCINTIQEFRLYKYKTDKLSGDILPQPEDKHNHWIDSLRYALNPIIKSSTFSYSKLISL